ncbi:MAG TPA: APC family permease [Thermoanaerobaculia bacterium]|nr:APC family permease [Thermoanaerobaculia bacterium]
MKTTPSGLHRSLSLVEYFTFGFGTMVGVGWVVLIDDWLGRGGPGGAALGFLVGGILLLPIARTYGRLVARFPDAGAEIAYAERVLPAPVAFAAAWTMVLSYAIVCPWEAAAVGNLLARIFPDLNTLPLYEVTGRTIFAPRLALGIALTVLIAWINDRGVRPSGVFQDVATFGLLAFFAIFTVLAFARGNPANLSPLFARPGSAGSWLSILLVLQVVPYFMTGFESVGKESEEARPGFPPERFARAITLAAVCGFLFYTTIVLAVAWIFPWRELVLGRLGTEAAFARAFRSPALARLVVFAAFLSLVKIFNGNFVAATRMLYGIARRGLVHPSLARVHPRHGTPRPAIVLMAVFSILGALLGDAVLVPISEVGSLAVGVGWLSSCVAYLALARSGLRFEVRGSKSTGIAMAAGGAIVASAIVLMKIVPGVPGSFTRWEWLAFGSWSGLGLVFWLTRRRASGSPEPI